MSKDLLLQANAAYVDDLYRRYLQDPASVPADWRDAFASMADGPGGMPTMGPDGTRPASVLSAGQAQTAFVSPSSGSGSVPLPSTASQAEPTVEPTIGVFDLIHSYRELGHLIANLNPLGGNPTSHPLLELEEFGFNEEDLDRTVACPSFGGCNQASLRDLIVMLRATYCGTLGIEYMHISDKGQRSWLQERIEPNLNVPVLSASERRRLLTELTRAHDFEQFLHTKFLGQKRFSLEGGESLVPLLNTLVEEAGNLGVEEIVMGMPHRGRLNVMANVLGKPYDQLFAEFEGSFLPATIQGDGDVKYHLGYARDHVTHTGKKLHAVLMPNPSHLEAIDPVVEGIVHAKQQYLRDSERRRVMPLLLHGDAAFCGQGVVMETMSLSELRAYHNGGTIHIIIDNQVGFTASPSESRFTRYPSDLGKVFNAPVFHVNADDPEAAVQAARLAVGFRSEFKEDVIIDLVCYRRHGHNELDDPTFTQPAMYRRIKSKRAAHELYGERLEMEQILTPSEFEQVHLDARQQFESALDYARDVMPRQKVFAFGGLWEGMHWAGRDWNAHTQVPAQTLRSVMEAATKLSPTFNVHPKVKKLLDSRRAMLDGEGAIDWACAETLALGTLLAEGTNIRLSGQDSERGTFSQRHAVLHDMETDARIVPLNKVSPQQGRFTVINSMLSEEGVLGFEYGFASADPRNLVMWEAQYGDFANNAQVIIDQFIATAESKWQRQNGLVMLLPHGYEGQGPEHSSARLERYLQLCAENNMQVCYPTTPAQYFHLLRRQQHRSFRKPLIVMTPKSMLRHKLVVSALSEFTDLGFRNVIDEPAQLDPASVRRVVLCTGKTYYDLVVGRTERVVDGIAIVRVEQLYPFPEEEIRAAIERYPADAEVLWVQEESRNCGAWSYMEPLLREIIGPQRTVEYVGRGAAASPATGSYSIHRQERDEILNKALRQPAPSAEKQANVS